MKVMFKLGPKIITTFGEKYYLINDTGYIISESGDILNLKTLNYLKIPGYKGILIPKRNGELVLVKRSKDIKEKIPDDLIYEIPEFRSYTFRTLKGKYKHYKGNIYRKKWSRLTVKLSSQGELIYSKISLLDFILSFLKLSTPR